MTVASGLPVEAHGGPSKSDASVLAPKVSVVMSAMNGDPWIDECIQSVLAQTMQDFEFIIINDGSTDGIGKKLNLTTIQEFAPLPRKISALRLQPTEV